MSAQLARPHSHLSNRAKVRSALERKPVFKSVLENPFHISWPSLSANLQNAVLARLVEVLDNIPSRHASGKSLKKPEIVSQPDTMGIPEEVAIPANNPVADRVAPLQLIIGINAVTRALESQLSRKRVVVDNPLACDVDSDQQLSSPAPSSIAVVFVCRADVDPPALVDHMPYLVAGCNSPRNVTQTIKLVSLPKHSETTISEILAIRRAAVVAFPCGSRSFEAIQDILDSVPTISAPWLCPSNAQDPQLVPTHIKQLRTTAPKDMKSAREQRSKARTEARKKSLTSSQLVRRKPRVKLTIG